jgi:hypothetical protein
MAKDQTFERYAKFLKGYLVTLASLFALCPIPIGILKLIPRYESLDGTMNAISTIATGLIAACIFYLREPINSVFFTEGQGKMGRIAALAAPPALIFFAMGCLLLYFGLLTSSIQVHKYEFRDVVNKNLQGYAEYLNILPDGTTTLSTTGILKFITFDKVAYGLWLVLAYTSFFAAAQVAISLMALKEFQAAETRHGRSESPVRPDKSTIQDSRTEQDAARDRGRSTT